ncbi:MAG: peptidylprolyl isomerase [Candidatus Eisenbacteria bacterium]|nr:peptidylprolyl isomerase [Candidatus Eisenbacteria bacterium]
MKAGRILACAAVFLLIAAVISGVSLAQEGSKVQSKQSAPAKGKAAAPAAEPDEVAIMETNHGTFVLEFFPKDAPNHVRNFKKLAKSGFYDGTRFHRVIKGFMIQGGDPLTKDADPSNDGTGGPGYTINAEFNARNHLKGTLSMARAASPNSAGSQFFVCLEDKAFLDGQYTVFGRVMKGMGVVEKIGSVPVKGPEPSIPVEPVWLKKVTVMPRADYVKAEKAKTQAKPEAKTTEKTDPKTATGK